MASATLSAVPTGGALGHHDARGIHVAADRAGHRQRFTQLEPVAGGVCEEESGFPRFDEQVDKRNAMTTRLRG